MLNETCIHSCKRRKKKSPTSIISPSFFKKDINKLANDLKKEKIVVAEGPITSENSSVTNTSKTPPDTAALSTPNLNNLKRKGSALSLKSIQQKKELESKKKTVIVDPQNLPETPFTIEQALTVWNDYGKRMDKKGERIIGSMFAMNKPTLKDKFILSLELPNETMRIDVERISKPMLAYMHQALNNFSITLEIEVNEAVSVKHAFTPEDKYNKLKEKNPLVDKLKALFDLDL